MSVAAAKTATLRVNALGGGNAMRLAIEKAGDIHFTIRCPDWDDDDLPEMQDHKAFHEAQVGGYEVVIARRGYSASEGSGEYDADYAVISCSDPGPLYDRPDIVDPSPEYQAAVDRKQLDQETCRAGSALTRPRI